MNIAYKPPIPDTFEGSRSIKLTSEYRTRKGAKIWNKKSLEQLTQLRVLNVSYIECGELLGVNTKVVCRAVKNYKLQPIIDKLRADKINGVMGNV